MASPDVQDLEDLIQANSDHRQRLLERESVLRSELRSIIQKKGSTAAFEDVRTREREARAELTRNLEQYDVLVEKWAAEGAKP